MKPLKHFIYMLQVILIAWMSASVTSCKDESPMADAGHTEYSAVSIKVKMPKPIAVSTTSRAGVYDFNQMDDINILIANGSKDADNILDRVYFKFSEVTEGQTINGTTITYDDVVMTNGEYVREFKLVFKPEWFESNNIDLHNCCIFAVANWGSAIGETVHNLEALRNLRTNSKDNSGIIIAPNVMFGESTDDGSEPLPGGGPNDVMRKVRINLKRTAAMVSVQVDGSGLNKNICLSNFSISLHNVPTSCIIGKDNIVTTSNVVANGEFKESTMLNWNPIVGTTSNADCGRETWKEYANSAGGHYTDTENVNPTDPDYRNVSPLFLFENIHGANFGAEEDDQQYKRPAGVDRNEGAINNANQTKTCSYLRVTAHYERIDAQGNSVVSGNVAFKFFLGNDVLKNFDVEGNHYYKVTLTLNGNAVTEGGQIDEDGNLLTNPGESTWRVDTDLSSASFITGDINLNASGEFFYVDVAASDDEWTVEGKGDYFIWVYGKSNITGSAEMWQSAAEGTIIKPLPGSNGRLLMYAQQGFYDFVGDDIYRELTLTLTPSGGENSSSITIRQYKQVEFTVAASEYPYIREVFGAESMTFFLDRVDREARPWGFYGEELHVNNADGFDNTYYLFEENPEEGHGSHRTFAQRYLPFGTETRPNHVPGEYNQNETVIEDGGSAMIYAAMLYENQDNYSPSGTPDKIMARDFPEIDRSHDYNNKKYYWAIPSIEAWQIIEKEKAQLDPNFPIQEWFPYWTSDAVTKKTQSGMGANGDSHAYTYQFGKGLDALKEGDTYPEVMRYDRRDRLRFRLLSVKPDQLPINN